MDNENISEREITELKSVYDLLNTTYVNKITFNNDNAKNILKKYIYDLYTNEEIKLEVVVKNIKDAVNKAKTKAKGEGNAEETDEVKAKAKGEVKAKAQEEKKTQEETQKGQQGGAETLDNNNNNINNILDLVSIDTELLKEIKKLSSKLDDTESKRQLQSLENNLMIHQKTILDLSNKSFPTKLLQLINKKIEKLNEINDKRFPKKQQGGSISTNNSIRRKIFTDLKYITKYLKYKTKYIVFKSKH